VTASDIEDGGPGVDSTQDALDAGLRAAPCGGEWPGQALIECAIDSQQFVANRGLHAGILPPMNRQAWLEGRRYTPETLEAALAALADVRQGVEVTRALRSHPLARGGYLGKHHLVHAYHAGVRSGAWEADAALLRRLRMKPIRTLSGVTTVTVLTKPYPCPGKCVFCPTDVRMPKSYLPDEPGAARALENEFDPFRQTASRLEALTAIGHPTDKIELLILGGTWSAYRRAYQAWFVQRCLDAMNGFDSADLEQAQLANEQAARRNVGLVVETRPDHVSPDEVRHLRWLGVTKVQLGAQSLDDSILALNHRGHTVADLRSAMNRLRRAGFKLVLHWMPNLLGATLAGDRLDFARLWDDEELRPDELKIYPCQLLANAELFQVWRQGDYRPYSTGELIELLADVKPTIPVYCRVNRVIRDIPSTHVVEGNRRTSLRQDVQAELARRATPCRCIRCREVRQGNADPEALVLDDFVYRAGEGKEHFLSLLTEGGALAAYARVSLPDGGAPMPELHSAALLRELHVVGQSLEFGRGLAGAPQHSGLGARLLAQAERIASESGYARLAVISALGTRAYYRRRGYSLEGTYMVRNLPGGDLSRPG
jgi:elongator complex protein 3